MDNLRETEHTVPYTWQGKQRFMVVKKIKGQYEKFYVIRTKKGEFTLQFYDMRWNIISPKFSMFDRKLLNVIGESIFNAGL